MSSTSPEPGASLTFDLRGLVWGIESEVAQISVLCRRIDEHVRAVNGARRELVQRLGVLDELVAATEDPDLRAWLDEVTQPSLPRATEHFPDRLYTD
jgi:hypothetical protein